MFIGLAASSILFLGLYLIAASFTYKKFTKESLNFRNVFPFEIWSVQYPKNLVCSSFLFISLACYLSNYILYATSANSFDPTRLIQAIVATVVCFSAIAIFFIPLSKLREHFICFCLFNIGTMVISAINFVNELRIYNFEQNKILLIPMAIDCLIIIVLLINVLHPNLFNLNWEKDNSGINIRPKKFQLAFSEWMSLFCVLFSQVSFIVISQI